MSSPKRTEAIFDSPPTHWVGDGFPVSSVFSPQSVWTRLSPYVLFDYGGPATFAPSEVPRGVDFHPHRGFETVTVVYQGELEHRDTAGNHGRIGPGDVQWMTAGAGVLHEEKHARELARQGGVIEMAQLWVNLPARHKMTAPRYQELRRAAIPVVALEGGGSARVIAGELGGQRGAASTFTPVFLWDVDLPAGASERLPVPEGFHAAVFVRAGGVVLGGTHPVGARQLAVLAREGEDIAIRSEHDAQLLVLGGEPIDEPFVAYGPFVMNTSEEIRQAIADARAGRLGRVATQLPQ